MINSSIPTLTFVLQLAAPADDHVPAQQEAHTGEPGFANVPGSHCVVMFEPSHAKPAGHARHSSELLELSIQYVPAEHESHSVWPVLNVYLPVGHSVQPIWPATFVYFPRAHSLQAPRPNDLPAWQ